MTVIGLEKTINIEGTDYDYVMKVTSWGTKPWDAPVTLKDMLLENIDENIASMIGDYHCNLFSIIDAEKLPKYKTELNELFNLLRMRNDGEGMRELVKII